MVKQDKIGGDLAEDVSQAISAGAAHERMNWVRVQVAAGVKVVTSPGLATNLALDGERPAIAVGSTPVHAAGRRPELPRKDVPAALPPARQSPALSLHPQRKSAALIPVGMEDGARS